MLGELIKDISNGHNGLQLLKRPLSGSHNGIVYNKSKKYLRLYINRVFVREVI